MPEIEAYQTINQMSVTIRDLNIVGNVLDRAVTLGSNQIGGISYSIDKPASLRDQVRKKAVADALHKAQTIFAQAAGFTLGPNHAEPSHKHAILILRLATLQLIPMHLET